MNALVQSHRRSFAILMVCCLCCFTSWAQLSANFTATPQSGCSPLVVYFSDLSTGNPTQWKWDLGNGVTTTLKNPSATYFNPGTYTVKLVVKNSSGADSIVREQYITVSGNPVVKFSASDTAGCFPMAVQFNDLSLPGSGNITGWQWDFGDGTISSEQHPSHLYTTAGNYTVTLKLTNSHGCVKTFTKPQYIKVSNGVRANFGFTSNGLCTAPSVIQFMNSSTGPGNLSYQWNFGDGNTSSVANPSHTYTSNGNYTVTLISISAQGCRDTIRKTNLLNIGTSQSNFSAKDTVCVNELVQFTNTSAPAPSSAIWKFSDGSTISDIDAVKKFTSIGIYQVKLVNNFGACKDSTSKQIVVVDKPHANFTAGQRKFCQIPATAQFNSQAPGTAAYLWLFGDGGTSTLPNPTHTYTASGIYHVTLIATNQWGCSDTVVKENFIEVQKPQILVTGLPATGCVPLTVKPVPSIQSNYPIVSYLWKFGDGTTSTSMNPTHVYNTPGNYDVTLIITNSAGCVDSLVMPNGVRTGTKPNANFGVSKFEVCNSDGVQFTDSSSNADQWLWIFGDNTTSSEPNPFHVFGDIGLYSITLVVWNNTCPDTLVKQNLVNVLPPISAASVDGSCTDKFTKKFINNSMGATRCVWSFGDGQTSTDWEPSHTYAAPGVYRVWLQVFNATCSNMNYVDVKVIDEKPAIVGTTTACKGNAVVLAAPGMNNALISSWHWNFGDNSFDTASLQASHVYTASGNYRVILTITDRNGCVTADTTYIQVFGPTAAFSTSSDHACLPGNNIQFFNNSVTDGSNSIVSTVWNFGDGTRDSLSAAPVWHQYSNTGRYSITLVVKDSYGCLDSITKTDAVIISQPSALFTVSDTMSCTGKNIAFTNASTGVGPQYQWSFGDGSGSASLNPVHSYVATGVYTIKLVVKDQYGCTDSLVKTDHIDISVPRAKFTVSDSLGNCPPLTVRFTNQSTGSTSLRWDFGDGNFSTLNNPSHIYNLAGTFNARLIVTGPGGCTDTAYQKIVIKGPTGSFSYAPIAGCNPLTVNFMAITQNTSSFVWDFSDGNTLSTNQKNPLHTYTSPGEYIPKIILTDAAGCHVPIIGKDTIRVFAVKASFTASGTTFCKAAGVQFTSTSVSNDLIVAYQWKFGDGNTSDEAIPSHHYASAGTYTVQLVTFTQHGCSDTAVMPNMINVQPAPSVQIASNLEACVPAVFSINGVINPGSIPVATWSWNFGNGQNGNVQFPAYQTYTTAGNFTISAIATAANGCRDTAIRTVTVHPLPDVNAGRDVEICRGGSIQLGASGAVSYTWNAAATLSCTNCPSPTVTPLTNTMYVVTGTSSLGCIQKDSVLVKVHQPFKINVAPGDTICAGSSVQLRASGADLYSWSPSSGVQNANSAVATAAPATSTTFTVIGRDRYNCFADTGSVFIKVWPIPTVNAGADQTLVVGQSLQLTTTSSADVSSWLWNNAASLSCATCPVTLAKPKQTTSYTVQVKNDGGCTATDQVMVNVICNNGNLFVPNTFSPNGDGVNDRFFPSGTGINRIKVLQVFNRWGEVVFERRDFNANDASLGWDGRYKGLALSPDVYIWNCEVICQNNEMLGFKGDLTLLK